jgi:uncharacterized protein (TIGR00369 family)
LSTPTPADAIGTELFVGFNAHLKFRFADWRPDLAALEVTIEPHMLNRSGLVHGGLLATVLDAALGYSGCFPEEEGRRRRAVTLSMTTTYVGQTKGGTIRATARRRGGGKSVFMATGEITDEAGAVLAIGEGTYRYIAETPR